VKLVVDNNVLVSRLLLPDSVPGRAVRRVVLHEQILVSEATMSELADTLSRPKFDRYVSLEGRRSFLADLTEIPVWISITQRIRACRDPRDDKFLELAINGDADAILTGDDDLLALHPFRAIDILTPAAWLQRQSQQ
jgi:putative PIN family toxin of toxin-antitoxin system